VGFVRLSYHRERFQTTAHSLCIEGGHHQFAADQRGDGQTRNVDKSTWELAGALIGGSEA